MERRKPDYILYTLILFAFGLTVFTSATFKVDNVRIDNEKALRFNDGWICLNPGGDTSALTLPCKVASKAGETVTIMNRIPDNLGGLTLAFLSSDQLLKVSFDGKESYSFGYHDNRAFGETPGTAWHFIQIPSGLSDKTVTVEFRSPYNSRSGNLPDMYIGTKSACVFYLLKSHIAEFVLCCFILLFGIALIILSILIKNLKTSARNLFYLGLFSVIMSVASMIETRLLQFFLGNQSVFSVSIFLLHLIAPVPMILYLGNSFLSGRKHIYNVMAYVFELNFIISTSLHIFRIKDFSDTIRSFHILLVLSCCYIIFSMVKLAISYQWNPRLISFCGAQLVLIVSVLIDILRFYIMHAEDVTASQRLGLLVYITILSILDIRKVQSLMKQGVEAENLRHLAYEDALTKCKNRIYFEESFTGIEREIEQKPYIAIAVFDVNNLKKINDRRGHSKGDSMLIYAAELIKKYFSEYTDVCRIGGDEFAFVITDTPPFHVERIFNRFKQAMIAERSKDEIGFDIAYGYAYFNPDIDRDLQSTFNRADSKMYECKRKMKNSPTK